MDKDSKARARDPDPGGKKFEERDWDDISMIKRPAARSVKAGEEEPAAPPEKRMEKVNEEGPAALLEEMKAQGITGAIVRNDGFLIHSTIAMTDTGANFLSLVANVAQAMMKRASDAPKEIEVSFGTLIIVLIPVNNHVFCGAVKSRDQKKTVREFAEKAKSLL